MNRTSSFWSTIESFLSNKLEVYDECRTSLITNEEVISADQSEVCIVSNDYSINAACHNQGQYISSTVRNTIMAYVYKQHPQSIYQGSKYYPAQLPMVGRKVLGEVELAKCAA